MKTFYTFTLLLFAFISNAQQTISGTVVDEKMMVHQPMKKVFSVFRQQPQETKLW
jgi:hypothetical protein